MKLSIAMMLGSATCKMVAGDLNTCAIGAAANAVGSSAMSGNYDYSRLEAVLSWWPWLGPTGYIGEHFSDIAVRFDVDVCDGRMTLEQLADYVRSIEPSCESCCSFDCTCDKAASPESITQDVCITEAA